MTEVGVGVGMYSVLTLGVQAASTPNMLTILAARH